VSRGASAAEILEGTIWLLRRGAGRCALVMILLTSAVAASEHVFAAVGPGPSLGMDLALLAAAVAAPLWLIRGALADVGRVPPRRVRLGAYFLLSFLYFAASAAGMLSLLVPGLVIAVRWWVAAPLMIDRELSPVEALAESWRETNDRFWPLLAVAAVFWLPVLASLGAVVWSAFPNEPGMSAVLIGEVVANGALILAALSSVAAYAPVGERDEDLPEVFA
jgi:hypothetical protein